MRTVVFDLDGTLADTSADLIAAANHCFHAMGQGALLDPVADASTAFRGGRAMLKLGLSRMRGEESTDEAAIDRWYPVLIEAYGANIDRETTLYPGAFQAVDRLRDLGFAVAVCTNKPEGLARELLHRLGILDRFHSLVGADTLPVRKPDPAPYHAAVTRAGGRVDRSFLVGDTETDHATARAVGVPSVLVTFGPEGQGVADLAPDALLPDFASLPDLAQRLIAEN
jgi:phosphoglycolate phosphatase